MVGDQGITVLLGNSVIVEVIKDLGVDKTGPKFSLKTPSDRFRGLPETGNF